MPRPRQQNHKGEAQRERTVRSSGSETRKKSRTRAISKDIVHESSVATGAQAQGKQGHLASSIRSHSCRKGSSYTIAATQNFMAAEKLIGNILLLANWPHQLIMTTMSSSLTSISWSIQARRNSYVPNMILLANVNQPSFLFHASRLSSLPAAHPPLSQWRRHSWQTWREQQELRLTASQLRQHSGALKYGWLLPCQHALAQREHQQLQNQPSCKHERN